MARLAYYYSVDGPTIRIDINELPEVVALVRLFEDLAYGRIHEEVFSALKWVECNEINKLILEKVEHSSWKSIIKLKNKNESFPSFRWINDYEGWITCADLISPFLEQVRPGHQYITEVNDDAIVEFCFQELPID